MSLTDGAGYVEDGREIFDDDLNEDPGANEGSKAIGQCNWIFYCCTGKSFSFKNFIYFLVEKEEKKKSKNPNIVRPGSKPKTTIKSMFAAQSSTGGSKLKSEVMGFFKQ